MAVVTADPASVALEFLDVVVNQGNFDAIANYIAPGYVDQTIDPSDVLGPQGLRQRLVTIRTELNGFRVTVDATIVEGSSIALRETATATLLNGQSVTVSGIDIFTVENGLITERWGTW